MPTVSSRRKATTSYSAIFSLNGNIRIDLSAMNHRVGLMPDTLAECVKVAIRMWCAKYHNGKYGPNRAAELPSIVWELMLKAPANATVSSVAHWACIHLINNKHMERNDCGSSPHRRGMEEQMHDGEDHPDYGNPAEVAQCHADFDAFVETLDALEARYLRILLEHFASGGGAERTPIPEGWSKRQKYRALSGLQRKYQALHWASPATADWVRRMLAA